MRFINVTGVDQCIFKISVSVNIAKCLKGDLVQLMKHVNLSDFYCLAGDSIPQNSDRKEDAQMARSIHILVLTIFILFADLTIAGKTLVAAPTAPAGPFDEWHQTQRSGYQSKCQELEPPLKTYFESQDIVVEQLNINEVMNSYWSNVGADNFQSRDFVQIKLNGQSLNCYVKSFVGFIGHCIVSEAQCFRISRRRFCWK